MNVDGLTMFVSSTAANGVVGGDTRLHFSQLGERVFARYSGGSVVRGWLVGRWQGAQLAFRYAQVETDRTIHGGRSLCDVERLPDGRVRVIEHFAWKTRPGTGTNVFEELPAAG